MSDVAGAVEIDPDLDAGLRGLALQLGDPCCSSTPSSSTSSRAFLNAAISSGVPAETRSHPSGPTTRISTPRSSRPCQTACRSANRPNRTKLASDVGDLETLADQPGREVVPGRPQPVDGGQHLVGVGQRDPGDRLGDGRQVVRQPDDPQRVDERRRGRQIAEPAARERERLGHGPADRQPRVVRQQLQRARGAGVGELEVRLVHHHDARRRLDDRRQGVEVDRGAGRVVGAGDQDDVGPLLARPRRPPRPGRG